MCVVENKDVEDLVEILQKSENHMLAIRVILSTWCKSASSTSQVIFHCCVTIIIANTCAALAKVVALN